MFPVLAASMELNFNLFVSTFLLIVRFLYVSVSKHKKDRSREVPREEENLLRNINIAKVLVTRDHVLDLTYLVCRPKALGGNLLRSVLILSR